jgi:hypothetical protein
MTNTKEIIGIYIIKELKLTHFSLIFSWCPNISLIVSGGTKYKNFENLIKYMILTINAKHKPLQRETNATTKHWV